MPLSRRFHFKIITMTPVKVSKAEFKAEIVSFFEQYMSIEQGKTTIIEKMRKDEYDNYIKFSNVRMFYSTNANYAEGGTGWYLTNGKDTVKI